jgi:uncharacterized protein (DUF1800 family)
MARGPDPDGALVALNRFGLGARPGDLALAASDPRGFLLEELRRPRVARLETPSLSSATASLQAFYAAQNEMRLDREQDQANAVARAATQARADMQTDAPAAAMAAPVAAPKPKKEAALASKLFHAEASARFQKQAAATAGFVERLVAFWSNHFAVSTAKGGPMRALVGPFEREAVRPHALGRFADLLEAVETHPAMLFYLDNRRSIGPGSAAGRLAGRGLNENFAREILELHTLGVDGGYSQADVIALARILTGWSVGEAASESGEPGAFVFKSNWHEPGAATLLGKRYAEEGLAQGRAALGDIARRRATATHVATKMARHFVADDPPPPLVSKLADTFRRTDGDLAEVAAALVAHDLAWRAPLAKIRSPNEFLVAVGRGSGYLPSSPKPYLEMLNAMGMPLWGPPGPNGFSDATSVWASPEGMKLRLDAAWTLAQRVKEARSPLALLDTIGGVGAARTTRDAVAGAPSRQQALAIIFMSPEFQRR